jgi:hypothetical protein
MRLHFIVKITVALGLCVFFARVAFPQTDKPAVGGTPKFALSDSKVNHDLMSPMGRLAQAIAKARAQQPNMGNGRSFRSAFDFDSEGDSCPPFDDECGKRDIKRVRGPHNQKWR